MENVLITGGAGFIGSHVGDLLVKNGYNVFVVDNLSSGRDNNLNKKVSKFYNYDINSTEIEKIFKENKIDYVFHFAAQASVSYSTKFPTEDAIENILGSINMLKYSKKYNVKKFIVSSTAAVYGIPEYLPVDEKHKTTCLSCYGVSKLTMEKYLEIFGLDYIIFRFANVYGPRQSAHGEAGVVAIFADKMQNNEDIKIDGDGQQTRDFVYVEDIARACLSAIQSDVKNEIINVSTNEAISINKLFEIMAEKFGYTKLAKHGEDRIGDIKHSILDNTKCKELLNYTPKTSLKDGLNELVIFLKRTLYQEQNTKQIQVETNLESCSRRKLVENYYKENSCRKSKMTLDDFMLALKHIPKDFTLKFGGISEPFFNEFTQEMILFAFENGYKISLESSLNGISCREFNKFKDINFEEILIHTPDISGKSNIEVTIDYLDKLRLVKTFKSKNIMFDVDGIANELVKNLLEDELILKKQDDDVCKKIDCKTKISCGHSGYNKIPSVNVILPDGSLLLCQKDFDMKYVLGNLYLNSYFEICNGKIAKNILKSLNGKTSNELICRTCAHAVWNRENLIKKIHKSISIKKLFNF